MKRGEAASMLASGRQEIRKEEPGRIKSVSPYILCSGFL